jgi:hypothetical protein
MSIEFKPVKLEGKAKRAMRQEQWRHVGKTVLYMFGGAAVSLVFTYLSDGARIETWGQDEISQSALIGAFMGFFITNSPCARGRC